MLPSLAAVDDRSGDNDGCGDCCQHRTDYPPDQPVCGLLEAQFRSRQNLRGLGISITFGCSRHAIASLRWLSIVNYQVGHVNPGPTHRRVLERDPSAFYHKCRDAGRMSDAEGTPYVSMRRSDSSFINCRSRQCRCSSRRAEGNRASRSAATCSITSSVHGLSLPRATAMRA